MILISIRVRGTWHVRLATGAIGSGATFAAAIANAV